MSKKIMKFCSDKNCVGIIALLVVVVLFIFSRIGPNGNSLLGGVNNKALVYESVELDESAEFIEGDQGFLFEGLESENEESEQGQFSGIIQLIKNIFNNDPVEQSPQNPVPENLPEVDLPNSCGIYDREKLYILPGETFDLSKNSLHRTPNIWSTIDGENWTEVAKTTAMGEKWEIMPLVVNNTAYVFGGKYKPSGGAHDNSIYMSKNMIDWTYLGELPPTFREYDRSMVYFKNKFWFISSQKSVGIYSSTDGSTWKQEVKTNLWDGDNYGNLGGSDVVSNSKGGYTSNSLGAYVLNNRIWYIVANNKDEPASQKKIYSSYDGVNWRDEGEFKIDGKNDQVLDIAWNTNPMPVIFRGEAWVISSNRITGVPMVIKTANGRDWTQVSNSSTKYPAPRYYSTMVAFNNKLWTLGGFNKGTILNYDTWSSINGKKWDKMNQYGVKSDGPANRHLAGGVVLTEKFSKRAPVLQVSSNSNVKVSFPNNTNVNENLGVWNIKLTPYDGVYFEGKAVITSVKILGTDLKPGFSSLQYMRNYKVYNGNVLIGSATSFRGAPYYDSNGIPLPRTIKLNKPIVLSEGETAQISINADFTLDSNFNNITTYLMADFDFADENSSACLVYGTSQESGRQVPGKTLIYRK